MFPGPVHALRTRARLALDDALGIAAQRRQRGVGAAQLERLAAEIPLTAGPAGHVALGMGMGTKRRVQDFAERKLWGKLGGA